MRQYSRKLVNICLVVFVVACLSALFTQHVFAAELLEEYDISASDDDNVVAKLYEDESSLAIEISGTGKMKDFNHGSDENLPPWYDYMGDIGSVLVEHGVTHIGDISFQECNYVTSITLPNGLLSIGDEAFTYHCCEDITIPSSVKSIGKNSFAGGQTDYNFTIKGNETTYDANEPPFDIEDVNVNVIAFEDSWTARNWSTESDYVTLETIPSFEYNEDKTKIIKYLAEGASVTIPGSVTTIGAGAFANHIELVSVNLGNVTTIEEGAFAGCDNLATIYGKSGSIGESLAAELDCEFVVLKPYLKDKTHSYIEKPLPVGSEDTVILDELFAADYATDLKFQLKESSSDFQDMDGSVFSFVGDEVGTKIYTFRAIDSDDVGSDDLLTIKYDVVGNEAPVRADDKMGIDIITTLGKQVEVNLTDVFTDPDGDQLIYKVLDVTGIDESAVDWNKAAELQVTDGKFTTERMWTLFVSDLGKEKKYLIRAFDKWGIPSADSYLLTMTMYGTKVHITKGGGVHDLNGISISFSRDGEYSVTEPAKIVDSDYYFNLEYQTRTPYGPGMEVFADGYTYAYTVKLEGCEDVTGSYSTAFDSDTNTINVELTNAEQAAKDVQSVADVTGLIDNLGEVTLDSEEAVTAAQEAYDALYDDLKSQVTNYNTLLQAKITLAELKLEVAKNDKQKAEQERDTANKDKKDAEEKVQAAEKEIKEAKAELAAAKAELAALKLTVKGLKVTSKKKKFTVKWKKNAKADGYRVQYKLSGAKKFKTLKTLTKAKAVTKKLKKGKKYEFRVATYKKVNGKKVFGKWTEAKIVKCK